MTLFRNAAANRTVSLSGAPTPLTMCKVLHPLPHILLLLLLLSPTALRPSVASPARALHPALEYEHEHEHKHPAQPMSRESLTVVQMVPRRLADCSRCFYRATRSSCIAMVKACGAIMSARSRAQRSVLSEKAGRQQDVARKSGEMKSTFECAGIFAQMIDRDTLCGLDIGTIFDVVSAGFGALISQQLISDGLGNDIACLGWDFGHNLPTSTSTLPQLLNRFGRNYKIPYATLLHLRVSRLVKKKDVIKAMNRMKKQSNINWSKTFSEGKVKEIHAQKFINIFLNFAPLFRKAKRRGEHVR